MSDRTNKPYVMPDYVIGRILTKCGRLRVSEAFKAAETALVVIDMQKFYMSDVQPAIDIVRTPIGSRPAGATVAWVKMTAGRTEAVASITIISSPRRLAPSTATT
jgi:ureidoacrylate peracid hydrolase